MYEESSEYDYLGYEAKGMQGMSSEDAAGGPRPREGCPRPLHAGPPQCRRARSPLGRGSDTHGA
jgi:hypothetical protein